MDQFNQEIIAPQQEQTFQNQTAQQGIKYAGFWIRLLANMVDGLLVSAINGLIVLIFFALGFDGLVIVSYALWIFFYFLYFIYTTIRYQATLGKMLIGVMVVAGDGTQASTGRVILRETVGKMVSSIFFSIGYIMAGFTERKRSLHDMIANTVVVYKVNQKAKLGLVALIIVCGIIVVGIEGYVFAIFAKNAATEHFLNTKIESVGEITSIQDNSLESVDAVGIKPSIQNDIKNNVSPSEPVAKSNVPTADTVVAAPSQTETPNSQGSALDNDMLDKQAKNKMQTILARLVLNFMQNKTYKGFVLTDDLAMPVNNSTCVTKTKLDIAPDGQSFVIHRPICTTALTQSFCLENGTQEVVQVNTGLVKKTYHCK